MFGFFIKFLAFFVSLIPHWTVVIDTEATDRNPGTAEILQVALVSGSGRILFNKYIKPETCTEWPEAQKINHISPKMVKRCRSISTYAPLINAYLKHTRKIVGYNLRHYDLPLLGRYGISTSAEVVDIIVDDADRRTKPGERQASYRNLTRTARHYGYVFIAHDAVEDCLATLHIYCLMHPGVRTILYFLRIIARIIIGAALIGICCSVSIALPDGTLTTNVFPFIIIACWSYLYGPIVGVLTTFFGISTFAGGDIPLIPVLLMSALFGVLYGMARSPKLWLKRVLMCILITIGGGVIALIGVPILLSTVWNLQVNLMPVSAVIKIIVVMLCGLPFYFIANHYLKKWL